LPKKTRQLEAKLGRLFPGLDPTAEFAWTGSFGQSSTGTPSIGRVPRRRHVFAVLGYGGNGFTFGLMHGTEAARAERAEQRLPTSWKRMRRPKNTRWLRRYATASGSNDQR